MSHPKSQLSNVHRQQSAFSTGSKARFPPAAKCVSPLIASSSNQGNLI
ncbi:MAG: hypothetical protein ACFB0D_03165 [Phormidesmis sp.]